MAVKKHVVFKYLNRMVDIKYSILHINKSAFIIPLFLYVLQWRLKYIKLKLGVASYRKDVALGVLNFI